MARLTPARLFLTVLLFAYLLGVGGWLLYSFITDTGVSGWLMQAQMRYLDVVRESMTMLGLLVVFMLGFVPLLLLLRQLNQREGYTPDFSGQQMSAAKQRSTKLMLAALSLGALLVAYFIFSQADARLQASPLVRVDLNAGQQVPAGARVARISGVFNADYLFILEEKRGQKLQGRTNYVPLTPAEWKPGQPVQVVLKTLTGAYYDSLNQRALVYDTATPFPATFDGTLSQDDLPTYVRQSLVEQGLKLASPVYVLDDQGMSLNQVTPVGSNGRWHIPALGVLMAAIFLFMKLPAPPDARR